MAEAILVTKTCPTCCQVFIRPYCKPCRAKYVAAWHAANADRVREQKLAYELRNKALILERRSARYANEREKAKAEAHNWYMENIEKARATRAAWIAANPEMKREYSRICSQNRRGQMKAGGGRLSAGLTKTLFGLQKGKCACCGKPLGKNYHLDHIVPLARGGAHEDSNMQLLTQRCNNQKHAKDPIDFMQSRGYLL